MIERVKASAGSGKTHRLTERFVSLLLSASESAPPPSCGRVPEDAGDPAPYGAADILAITFTNKAATEMKSRVVTALKTLALARDAAPGGAARTRKAARELDLLLRHAGRLNVRTIDSLLALLLRLFSLDMGLSPDFETVFDNARLFDPLFDRLAARLDSGDAELAGLFAQAADAVVRSGETGFLIRAAVLARLRRVFDHLAAGDGPLPDVDRETITQDAERLTAKLRHAALAILEAMQAGGVEPVSYYASLLARTAELASLTAPAASAYAGKADVADCLKKTSRDKAGPGLAELHRTFTALHALASRDIPLYADVLDWLPFTALAGRLLVGLPEMIREEGLLPAALWPSRVEQALGGGAAVPDAWCRMGARLTHLLIDEFQDTSLSQWAVLDLLAAECLSRGGGLFYVGDVKQAIYGWRGGAAGLFDTAVTRSGLDRLSPPRDETLPCNWRSARAVVDFNNRFFSLLADPRTAGIAADQLLPKSPPRIRLELAGRLEAAYADCAQALPPGRDVPLGRVAVRRLPGGTAAAYAENVREACLELLTADLLPRLGPSGVAILARTNVQAEDISRWLVGAGIPVVTENSLRLADHPLIRALAAFLAFVDYPGDNLAFFTFISAPELFSPVSGLPPGAIHDWAARTGEGRRRGSLAAAFARDFPDLWERLVRPFARQAGLTGAYDLVRELVAAYGALSRRPGDEPFVRRFLEVLYLAEERGAGSVSAFLSWWTQSGFEEKAPQPEHLEAVRVLTVHKAKGLEYPAVIVPFHHFRADPPADFGRVALDGREALAPMGEAMGEEQQMRRVEACLEQVNLVYVAWTRAARELHLFAPIPPLAGKYPVTRALDALFADMGITDAEAFFGEPPARPGAVASPEAPAPVPEPVPEPAASAPPAGPDGPEPLHVLPPLSWIMRLKVYRNSVRDVRDSLGFTEKKRGLAAHAAVEALRRMDLADPAAPLAAAREALAGRDCAPPDPRQTEDAAADIAHGLAWLLSLPDMAENLAHGLSERDILDEGGRRHRPDLLVFRPEHTLVADFKTGAPSPEHAAQVRRYLRLAGVLPEHTARFGADPEKPRRLRGLLLYLDRREAVRVDPE
ncbi:MAG: UvrD-helicase domain-containing protein [Desulfovibrionaceae bacterium]|nr:UvrD-helicase domain-containing protein [Desulfovibrionaceae bacterium]